MWKRPFSSEASSSKSSELIANSALLKEDWYYQIELAPGVITPGKFGHATVLTRRLLRHCAVTGRTCLDVGPMEGLIAAVLARRGAKKIVGIDISADHQAKIELVQKALGFRMDFHSPVFLSQAPSFFQSMNQAAFDIVIFSGVLYHVLDICTALGSVRGLVRTGGIFIFEAWISTDRSVGAHFNEKGKVTNELNTFWFVTLGGLDYLLRFFRLQPLDCSYFLAPDSTMRIAVACRAVDRPVAEAGDEWMSNAGMLGADPHHIADAALKPDSKEPIGYGRQFDLKLAVPGTNALSLLRFVDQVPQETVSSEENVLQLNDEG